MGNQSGCCQSREKEPLDINDVDFLKKFRESKSQLNTIVNFRAKKSKSKISKGYQYKAKKCWDDAYDRFECEHSQGPGNDLKNMSFSNIDLNEEYYAYNAPHLNEDYDEALNTKNNSKMVIDHDIIDKDHITKEQQQYIKLMDISPKSLTAKITNKTPTKEASKKNLLFDDEECNHIEQNDEKLSFIPESNIVSNDRRQSMESSRMLRASMLPGSAIHHSFLSEVRNFNRSSQINNDVSTVNKSNIINNYNSGYNSTKDQYSSNIKIQSKLSPTGSISPKKAQISFLQVEKQENEKELYMRPMSSQLFEQFKGSATKESTNPINIDHLRLSEQRPCSSQANPSIRPNQNRVSYFNSTDKGQNFISFNQTQKGVRPLTSSMQYQSIGNRLQTNVNLNNQQYLETSVYSQHSNNLVNRNSYQPSIKSKAPSQTSYIQHKKLDISQDEQYVEPNSFEEKEIEESFDNSNPINNDYFKGSIIESVENKKANDTKRSEFPKITVEKSITQRNNQKQLNQVKDLDAEIDEIDENDFDEEVCDTEEEDDEEDGQVIVDESNIDYDSGEDDGMLSQAKSYILSQTQYSPKSGFDQVKILRGSILDQDIDPAQSQRFSSHHQNYFKLPSSQAINEKGQASHLGNIQPTVDHSIKSSDILKQAKSKKQQTKQQTTTKFANINQNKQLTSNIQFKTTTGIETKSGKATVAGQHRYSSVSNMSSNLYGQTVLSQRSSKNSVAGRFQTTKNSDKKNKI
eukprot:403363187